MTTPGQSTGKSQIVVWVLAVLAAGGITLGAFNGSNLTNLNASNLSSGTVPLGRLSNITNTEISGSAAIAVSKLGTAGTIPANSGVNLTALNATQLTSGTVPDARLPANPSKAAVRCTSFGVSGTLASDFENGDMMDALTLATGDRVLINWQASSIENGIYVVNASGAPTRATDADAAGELNGAVVFVRSGTTHGSTVWAQYRSNPTPGTDDNDWTRVGTPSDDANPNQFFAGPATAPAGPATFRNMAAADVAVAVTPSTSGNVMTSNGTTWQSSATLAAANLTGTATNLTLVTPILGTPQSGNASNLTALNATQLTSGTVPLARLSGITNTEIATGAAIVDTKLAQITTASKVSTTAITGIAGSTIGGTGNGFTKFSGPATAEKTFTLPDATSTILTDNTAVTVAQGGTGRATSTTAYGVICAGTTATGAHQTTSSAGTSGNSLISGGASAVPAWAALNLAGGSNYVSGILPGGNGGTGNAFFAVTGPTTSTKTFTFPDATSTVLTSNAAVTVAQGGTGLATLTANNVILGNGTSTPTFVAPSTTGNVLTSNGTTWQSTAPAGGGDTYVYRTSDSAAVNNSTTFVDDGVLEFAVAVNKDYVGQAVLWVSTNSAANMKYQFTGPASPTQVRYSSVGMTVTNNTAASAYAAAFSTSAAHAGVGSLGCVIVDFSIMNGANSGTVKIQFAQNTLTVVDTKIIKGSYIKYKLLN